MSQPATAEYQQPASIDQPEWCDEHGPTTIVDDHIESFEPYSQREYRVLDLACGDSIEFDVPWHVTRESIRRAGW